MLVDAIRKEFGDRAEICGANSGLHLDDAVAAFNPTKRIKGKTIIRVRP